MTARVVPYDFIDLLKPVAGELEQVRTLMLDVFSRETMPELKGILDYLIQGRGKLLRPGILLLTSMVWNKAPRDACVALSGAVELGHLASLVHDDIIDHSAMRRGYKTLNAHFGDSAALLVGDYLLCATAELILKSEYREAHSLFISALKQVVQGELKEISYNRTSLTVDAYLDIINGKTASLFRLATEVGAIVSGVEPPIVEQMQRFGEQIGIAFQIRDDLLDFMASSEGLGKPAEHDLKEGVLSLPVIIALQKNDCVELVKRILSSEKHTEADVSAAYSVIRNSGAIQESEALIKEYAERALAEISDIPDNVYSQSLRNMAIALQRV